LGVAGELTMVWLAMPTIRRERPWSLALPNPANFAFDYFIVCIIISLIYIPGLPHMYFYMLRQRRKMLAEKPDIKASKKET